jgi:hypothetical protein
MDKETQEQPVYQTDGHRKIWTDRQTLLNLDRQTDTVEPGQTDRLAGLRLDGLTDKARQMDTDGTGNTNS